jgi:hypothetical protein
MVHRDAAARTPRQPRRPAYPVTVTRVDPAAWRAALQLAGGDAGRLVVTGPHTVIVLNRRYRP